MENEWYCPELYDRAMAKLTEGYGELRIESTHTRPNPFFSASQYLYQLAQSSCQIPAHLLEGKSGSYAITEHQFGVRDG